MENGERPQAVDTALDKKQKEHKWHQRTDELRRITDALGKPIEPGIFDTVVALNLLDIHTTQSCEGHLDHGLAAPWVEIQPPETPALKTVRTHIATLANTIETLEQKEKSDDELAPLYQTMHQLSRDVRRPQLEELQKATDLVAEFYQTRQVTYERLLTLHGNRLESQGALFQDIIAAEERRQKLGEYQEEMSAFTTFLKRKYFSP